jgi:hypothetical protein
LAKPEIDQRPPTLPQLPPSSVRVGRLKNIGPGRPVQTGQGPQKLPKRPARPNQSGFPKASQTAGPVARPAPRAWDFANLSFFYDEILTKGPFASGSTDGRLI